MKVFILYLNMFFFSALLTQCGEDFLEGLGGGESVNEESESATEEECVGEEIDGDCVVIDEDSDVIVIVEEEESTEEEEEEESTSIFDLDLFTIDCEVPDLEAGYKYCSENVVIHESTIEVCYDEAGTLNDPNTYCNELGMEPLYSSEDDCHYELNNNHEDLQSGLGIEDKVWAGIQTSADEQLCLYYVNDSSDDYKHQFMWGCKEDNLSSYEYYPVCVPMNEEEDDEIAEDEDEDEDEEWSYGLIDCTDDLYSELDSWDNPVVLYCSERILILSDTLDSNYPDTETNCSAAATRCESIGLTVLETNSNFDCLYEKNNFEEDLLTGLGIDTIGGSTWVSRDEDICLYYKFYNYGQLDYNFARGCNNTYIEDNIYMFTPSVLKTQMLMMNDSKATYNRARE